MRAQTTGREEMGSEIIRKGLQLLVIAAAAAAARLSEGRSKVAAMLADVTVTQESQTQIQSAAQM